MLWEEVDAQALCDWVLLGHSYGAGLAFELAKRAETAGRRARMCIISGRRAPSGRARSPRQNMTDKELLTQVAEWGALPREFQMHPALREMAVARLREDVTFSDELHARSPEALEHTALHTLAGRDDPVAPPEEVHVWRQHTNAASSAQTFDGDHFFLFSNAAAYHAIGAHLYLYATTPTSKGILR